MLLLLGLYPTPAVENVFQVTGNCPAGLRRGSDYAIVALLQREGGEDYRVLLLTRKMMGGRFYYLARPSVLEDGRLSLEIIGSSEQESPSLEEAVAEFCAESWGEGWVQIPIPPPAKEPPAIIRLRSELATVLATGDRRAPPEA